jgi:hypothetical protein
VEEHVVYNRQIQLPAMLDYEKEITYRRTAV